MIRALFTAATGMQAQQINIDVIANNLANVSTVGFKKHRADFQELLYETIIPPGSPSAQGNQIPTGLQIGTGVRPAATQKIFTEGEFKRTDNELDLAVEGEGFFVITRPSGETAYTRSGAFKLDSTGRLVTSEGFLLSPNITIPTTALKITVGTDGTVSVLTAGATTPTQAGQITLARFPNPGGLNSLGRNLFGETVASGAPTTGNPGVNGLGTLVQGFLENSNVSVVDELVALIEAQRAYEINSKAIQTSDEMLQVVANLKR
ncbi:MAG: flagellar basal-body rod protein FlgG [Candidatus Tectomicrobia bacterium]|uniref:Flagellar basal-body rod protein FlgG n=1 Tax=Tectimicrobiota bacterium TaxID=2528274 RepID=A0A932I0X2_UNCTE|nr:flagellar basal-body rod protein FlgG [Candidatus Tectomicrobia bacterium]